MTFSQIKGKKTYGDSTTNGQELPSDDHKILIYLVGEAKGFLSHRLPMARAARQSGYHVMVACPESPACRFIEESGFPVLRLGFFDRASINLIQELRSLVELVKLYRKRRPSLLHHVGIKSVLYGSLASLFITNVRIINALTGLGYIFTSANSRALLLRKVLKIPLRFLFNRKNTTILLQNQDDEKTLVGAGIVTKDQSVLIPGSGVDPAYYTQAPELPVSSKGIVVALVTRMLRDKGVAEVIEAARILRNQAIPIQFHLYGDVDKKNPSSFTVAQLHAWQAEGLIHWHGPVSDSLHAYHNCHIAVLASYREGMPKTLLEAASCGRAIVTTDVAGCREVVQDGVNGFIVPPQNSAALANAVLRLARDPDLRQEMGEAGRQRILEHFADQNIIEQTCQLYNKQ